ncbi:hypothetical protein I3760_04G100200 [Carya illinoinensis]|nr:hypothetical protein I3760_04G100200 [Carya illinoinensis]
MLSWNIRGLNDPNKWLRVKNLLCQWKLDIVCLQETKLEFIDRSIITSIRGCPFVRWVFLSSMGASGGIIMWDSRVVESSEECVGNYMAACSFRNVEEGFCWAFVGVYGPNMDSHRKVLWDELAGLGSWWNLPWCIGGDFTVTRFPSERPGDARLSWAMNEFSEFIFDMNLMNLPLAGGVHTWSRLDRFLQKRLDRVCSDHFSIVLDCGGIQEGKRYFKFENIWLKVEGFVDKVSRGGLRTLLRVHPVLYWLGN